MQKLTTCLMFVGDQYGKAEEAMNLYVSLFENSRILEIERWPATPFHVHPGDLDLRRL